MYSDDISKDSNGNDMLVMIIIIVIMIAKIIIVIEITVIIIVTIIVMIITTKQTLCLQQIYIQYPNRINSHLIKSSFSFNRYRLIKY